MSEEQTTESMYKIPNNTISTYIARVCETPGDSFASDGILWVDTYDLDGSLNGPKHGENGSTEQKAIASWTLRSAYIAWNNPPKIKYKGHLKLKGKVTLPNATLSSVNIVGGPPMNGVTAVGPVSCPSTIPVAISNASGSMKIEQFQNAELDVSTEGSNLDIELTSQKAAQLPWCVKGKDSKDSDDTADDTSFIREGDMALCLAFSNSVENLYVIDIFR